jgi:hypothetical protein
LIKTAGVFFKIYYIGPRSCANEGLGSVQVIPTTMIAGMNPQCNAVLAMGAAFSQILSAEANNLLPTPLIAFDGISPNNYIIIYVLERARSLLMS